MTQRSLLLFENSIKARRQYLYYLNQFKNHFKLRDCDNIVPIRVSQAPNYDYVMDLKKRVNPNTVPTPMYAFLEANDIKLKWKKIR